ncbi:hypothetical protein AA313_de0205822 [Arthrobotrys entomopaga]|nr:hypothetical protein AA313_de0205822 [Arthrobotrys entomopaga]
MTFLGRADTIILHFEALQEPSTKDIAERDAMVFVKWMQSADVQCDQKGRRSDRLPGPKPRPEDNRERTKARLKPPATITPLPNTPLLDMAGQGTGLNSPRITEGSPRLVSSLPVGPPIRRSTRNHPSDPLIKVPKPDPHPPQSWSENLKFPFAERRSEFLECKSLRLLDADEFLNDEVINFHLSIVRETLKLKNPELAEKVYIFNTYLYTAYTSQGDRGKAIYDKVKRFAKDDIFKKEFVFIPVNEKFHWFLAVICNLPAALESAKRRTESSQDDLICIDPSPNPKTYFKKNGRPPVPAEKCTVIILDSMNGLHNGALKTVKQYLRSECLEKHKVELDLDDLTGLLPRKIPGQTNFSDCGLFMLHYIEKILENPSQIKKALYERDFGTGEEARKLWKPSEVVNKRDRMWRHFVKLNEEYEKFLAGDTAYNQFPEIDEIPTTKEEKTRKETGDKKAEDDDELMLIDHNPKTSPKIQSLQAEATTPGIASPAKRKSSEQDDERSPPSKRAKSISPNPVHPPKKPKSDSSVDEIISPLHPVAAPGLVAGSPEIPYSDDVMVYETGGEGGVDLAENFSAPAANPAPLIAANGLRPLSDSPEGPEVISAPLDVISNLDQVFGDDKFVAVHTSSGSPSKRPNGNLTPSIDAAESFNDLDIGGNMKGIELEIDDIDDDGDTPMVDAGPRHPVEEIEDFDDDNTPHIQDAPCGGEAKMRGKSANELANDRIVDESPSSQDQNVSKTPTKQRGNGNTVYDPIVLDSQTSPKRSGLRSSSITSK